MAGVLGVLEMRWSWEYWKYCRGQEVLQVLSILEALELLSVQEALELLSVQEVLERTVDPGSSGQSLDGVGPGSSGSYLVGAGEKENRLYAGFLGLLPQPISRM